MSNSKSINALASEAAEKYSNWTGFPNDAFIVSFVAGSTFATNLTFERICEFLRENVDCEKLGWHGEPVIWLLEANREKILNGGGE